MWGMRKGGDRAGNGSGGFPERYDTEDGRDPWGSVMCGWISRGTGVPRSRRLLVAEGCPPAGWAGRDDDLLVCAGRDGGSGVTWSRRWVPSCRVRRSATSLMRWPRWSSGGSRGFSGAFYPVILPGGVGGQDPGRRARGEPVRAHGWSGVDTQWCPSTSRGWGLGPGR